MHLLEAAAAQWNGMLREYALRGIGGREQPYSLDEVAQAESVLARVQQAARPSNLALADLSITYTADMSNGASRLQGVLDDALHLIDAGDLLALPPLPEIVTLRNWLCDQIIEQAAGVEPKPWTLSSEPGLQLAEAASAQWDPAIQPPADTAWIIGDDQNRIVAASPPALDLLGWTADDLISQRLLVVIPEALRVTHIAGFTRSVVSGGGDLLGQSLALPALHRNGHELPILLTLTRHAARHGRHVYVAQVEAQGQAPR
ncbi:MAG: PAS domain-containing protein [Actinomycetota bacterium]|nr:PAS domain-containing protein [Actinomycetota bacterium]